METSDQREEEKKEVNQKCKREVVARGNVKELPKGYIL